LLELDNLFVGESIRLGNHGNQVDLGMKAAHKFNVNLLEPIGLLDKHGSPRQVCRSLRMARRLDEVDAGVNTVINHFLTVDTVFLLEIRVEASLNIFNNWLPAIVIINKVAEPRGVNNGQAESYAVLLNVYPVA
jgi:hypothetical protein